MFTRPNMAVNNIQTLGDITLNQATAIKALHDKFGVDAKEFLITFLAELESGISAGNIGATESIPNGGSTVQSNLNALYASIISIVLGQIPDGTLTDAKLSNAVGQIKDAVNRLKTVYTSTNVGNTYSITTGLTSLIDGQVLKVKCNADSTDSVLLNPDGLGDTAVVKSTGLSVINWKLNGIYTLIYNATTGNFILQGEGGEYGTAVADKVLTGYTIGTESGVVSGTMPDRVGDTVALSSARAGTVLKLLASNGYRDGINDYVTIDNAYVSGDTISPNVLTITDWLKFGSGYLNVDPEKQHLSTATSKDLAQVYQSSDSIIVVSAYATSYSVYKLNKIDLREIWYFTNSSTVIKTVIDETNGAMYYAAAGVTKRLLSDASVIWSKSDSGGGTNAYSVGLFGDENPIEISYDYLCKRNKTDGTIIWQGALDINSSFSNVTTPDGNIVITTDSKKVIKLGPASTSPLWTYTSSTVPKNIVCDADGNVYFTNTGGGITKLNSSGQFQATFSTTYEASVTFVDTANNRLYYRENNLLKILDIITLAVLDTSTFSSIIGTSQSNVPSVLDKVNHYFYYLSGTNVYKITENPNIYQLS